MLYEMNLEESKEKKPPISKNRYPWLLCFIIVVCAIVEYRANHWLPDTLVSVSDTAERFSVSNAKEHLKTLTSLGPRIVGSFVTEVTAPLQLLNALKKIKDSSKSNALIEIDEQHPSSHFHIDFLGGINNVYSNVTNVIAKISWPTKESKSKADDEFSILINAHYDSVPGSPGAADDGLGVACMLEVLRVLSIGPSLRRPVVFLFNGAEESNHQAAHGFITQHKWAPAVKYLINLEATGSGGHELVFQCNSGWLANFYSRRSPYPHTQVIAHELFKNFLYRVASTDWSTIIKYGTPGMKGIDTAYIENGYVYHTSFDNMQAIPDGTYMNTGENVLEFVRALSTATILKEEVQDTLSQKYRDEHAVFFDFLGTIVIVYSGLNVLLFHSLAVLFGLYTVYTLSHYVTNKHIFTVNGIYTILLDELLCIWVPAILCGIVGVVMYFIAPMRWYRGGVYVGCLMYLPCALFFTVYIRSIVTARSHNHYLIRQIATLLMFCMIAVPFIALNIMSGFIFCMWIVNMSIAALVQLNVKLYYLSNQKSKLKSTDNLGTLCDVTFDDLDSGKLSHSSNIRPATANRYLYSPEFYYLLCMVPMITMWNQTIHFTFTMLIPLLGKSGTTTPADPLLGALFGLLIAVPAGCVVNNEINCTLAPKTTRNTLIVLVGLYVGIVVYFSSSYSNDRPKRLWIQHVERYTQDSYSTASTAALNSLHTDSQRIPDDFGLWVSAFDSNGMSPLKSLNLPSLQDGNPTTKDALSTHCTDSKGDCYFDFPWYFPVADALKDSVYIATDPRKSKEVRPGNTVRVDGRRPEISDKERLQLTATSTVLTTEYCTKMKCDDSIINLIHKTSSGQTYRMVNITMFGPTHMGLVVRDNQRGKRVPLWRVNEHIDDTRNHMYNLMNFENASPVRAEGIYYFQIGYGLCSVGRCMMSLQLIVSGKDSVDIAAYGHYTELDKDKAILDLIKSLPQWSKGAEWTNFPSIIIRDKV